MEAESLESYLQKYDSARFQIYENIKSACKKIWKNPRLGWYTDHGVEHSKRIVSILAQICDGLLQNPETQLPDYGLAPQEVFLLLSASWLHDIGMQDLKDLNDSTVDTLTGEDWNEVRKRHPQRSYDIIMDFASGSDAPNEFQLGFQPDDNFQAPLALICKGHGSDYFEEVLNIFKGRTFNLDGKNKKIRGELLTSLLLIADELDLHHSRATINNNYPISKISRLHFFRHHYIQHVSLAIDNRSENETDKRISLTFTFPDNKEDWTKDLEIWIVDKLKFEMNRTIEHIRKGFNGHFLWADPPIIIKTEISLPKEKKSLDEDIKYLLKSNAQKLIDWKSCINELESRFSDRKGGFIQLKAEKEDGSELFISLLEYLFLGSIGNIGIDKPRPLVVLNLGVLNVFHQYDEIICEIGVQLGIDISAFDQLDHNVSLLQHLFSCIQESHRNCLIVLQDLDGLDRDIYEKFKTEILTTPVPKENITFLFNTNKTVAPLDTMVLTLPKKFEEKDILDYFLKIGNGHKTASKNTKIIIEMQKRNGTASEILQFAECIRSF